jgi:7-carboxy-7-deazaguanine synthase
MVINEIFYSLQGEGFLAGVPGVFIRLAGCPLRCKWCDTKYAWDKEAGRQQSISEIVRIVQQTRSKFVVITGGEPMVTPLENPAKRNIETPCCFSSNGVNPDLPELVKKLKDLDKHITIETAGIAYIPEMPCDLMSISPKMSNSTPNDPKLADIHENSRLDLAVLCELIDNYAYQLKFVVDSEDDLSEIQQTVEEIGSVDLEKVMLMPQAATREELLAKSPMVAEMCKKSGFTFCQRLQVLLWNNQRGT